MAEVPVISYLHYLHEVSRKILQRGGFENVLYGKTRKQQPCYLDFDNPGTRLPRYFRDLSVLFAERPGRGLFLGLGLIIGQIRKESGTAAQRGRKRNICAPLFYCAVGLPDPNGSDDTDYEIVWESLTFNYDLLTLILEHESHEEPEDIDFGFERRVAPEKLKILADIEKEIDDNIDSRAFQMQLRTGNKVREYMARLKDTLAEFSGIDLSSDPFLNEELADHVASENLKFFGRRFLFVAPVADQLSTTLALRKLIHECESEGFQNSLLEKLFDGVLRNAPIDIRRDLLSPEEVNGALDLLPMPISENQREAICNAWCSEISYVQGPPGTGKSHTITALMLSALFLGKRVLMVSHKKPAVEIVRSKLEDFLGQGSVIYLGPTTEQKRDLRGKLQQWCSDAGTLTADRRLRERQEKLNQHRDEAERVLNRVRTLEDQIKTALENEKEFVLANEAFLQQRAAFSEAFGLSDERSIRLSDRIRAADSYRKHLERAHYLLRERCSAANGFLPRRDWLYLRRLFAVAVSDLFAERERLEPNATATQYLLEQLELTLANQRLNSSHLKITPDFLANQRRLLAKKLTHLALESRELVKARFRHHVTDRIRQSLTDVQNFDRLLHWRNPNRIVDIMQGIDYDALTQTFPLWVGEMRHLGEFLPFASELFDLVIVDESSQVNIAEIIPAFYRGSRFCVVGDKKQLGLNAAGLFALNQTFEQLIWAQHFGKHHITHVQADERDLLVSRHSILDFMTCANNRFTPPKSTLKEHFRSLPHLASFTSDQFYADDGGLRLMKELPKNVRKECFRAIAVKGQRHPEDKVVPEEVDELLKWLKYLIRARGYLEDPQLKMHGWTADLPPTIGAISVLTFQRNYIQTRIEEEFNDEEVKRHDLMVGTPEDFQGNERNIIFLTLGLDGVARYAKAHYEDPHRFNVATSRAIDFTFCIYAGIPRTAALIKKYLRHFGATWIAAEGESTPDETASPADTRYAWRYHEGKRESKFEVRIDECLHDFIRGVGGESFVHLYNQVECCGQKRLDFVLFNERSGECCAVEVDGRDHYSEDGRSYSEAHLDRVDVLQRAGWKIVHVPYYHWYRGGWLCDQNDSVFQKHLADLHRELKANLRIA